MGEKKGKSILKWVISIFFILSGLVYLNETLIPSIIVLITGILLLPFIDDKIKSKIKDKTNLSNYNLIRNMIAIIFLVVLAVNIPTYEILNKGQNSLNEENIINQISKNQPYNTTTNFLTEKNGTYTGEIINNKKEGEGKYEWNDGSWYEGEFKNNQIHGKGKLIIPQKGRYEGEFKNGKKDGNGKYQYINGDIYEGEWVEDKMEGKGKYTFSNGDIYEGQFKNNQFDGEGTYKKDKNIYTGIWKNNEYQSK